jgi:hypothetical protein
MGESLLITFLFGLLLFQQIFWSYVVHQLVNKLMSRNYFEFKQADQAFDPKPHRIIEPEAAEDLGALDGVGGF